MSELLRRYRRAVVRAVTADSEQEWDEATDDEILLSEQIAARMLPDEVVEAAKSADWEQVVLNGGPPCFHIDNGRFCLRTRAWAGHGGQHAFTTLADRLQQATP